MKYLLNSSRFAPESLIKCFDIGELRDSEKLPNWIKANPHKSTYSNMLLYLRKQVEAFAWSKWGSPEALDAEFVRRDAAKQVQKDKKFKKKLAGK